jgi:hypothetical protein
MASGGVPFRSHGMEPMALPLVTSSVLGCGRDKARCHFSVWQFGCLYSNSLSQDAQMISFRNPACFPFSLSIYFHFPLIPLLPMELCSFFSSSAISFAVYFLRLKSNSFFFFIKVHINLISFFNSLFRLK